jgi:tetratricopeptide (TPR) repeat protein/predicted Ser/Thr protein kinase
MEPTRRWSRDEAIELASSSAIPERLGHYRIVRKIAEGGMGAVYEAEQENPRRTVALKVVRAGFASEELLRRFQHEAQILGRLHHPGIAQVFEAGTAPTASGPQPFFAMELVDGEPLTEYAQRHRLDVRGRLELMVQICDAVHHAHQKGVIHRDLKPANILVDARGQPKILDFGVARATDSDVRNATLQTDVGQLLGTLPYMSPEQVAADPLELDTRSDVYALGVILYELLSGQRPYDLSAKMIHEAARVIRETDPVPISSIDRVFRGDVEIIVEKALEKDKTRRYASAAELASDIQRHLRDEPIVARPASTIYQLRKFARRNKVVVLSASAVFVALVAGLIASRRQAVRAMAAENLARQRLVDVDQALGQVEAKRKEAEANFGLARDAVARYLENVSDNAELKAHGLEPLRKHLLETARDFYDEFVRLHGQDPALRADLAEAYFRLGNIRRETGDRERAVQDYEHAAATYEALGKEGGPDADRHARQALVVGANLGLVLSEIGKNAESEAAFRRALRLEALVEKDASPDPFFLASVANAYDNLGTLLDHTGRGAEGEKAHLESIRIRERLVKDHPDDPQRESALVMSYDNLGALYATTHRLSDALPYLEKSVEISEKLVQAHPEDADQANTYGATLNNLGAIYTLLGRIKEARATHERALPVREKAAREHPAMLEYRIHLAGTYCNLGELGCREGLPDRGLERLDQAAAQLEGVLSEHPQDATARYYLSYTSSWRGRALDELGRADEALAAWERAISFDDRNDATLRAGKAEALARLGRCDEAAAQAGEVSKRDNVEPDVLCSLAGVLGRCSPGDDRRALEAVALLRRAAGLGDAGKKSVATYLDGPEAKLLGERADLAGLRTELGSR